MQNLNKNEIIRILETFDSAVERSVVLLQKLTVKYQDQEFSNEVDGKGFSRPDKNSGAYYASWVNAGNALSGYHLSKCRDLVKKYWRQIGSNKSFQEKFKCFPTNHDASEPSIYDEVWSDPEI